MIDRLLPAGVTKRLQILSIAIGIVGFAIAFFLPTGPAVRVINLVSMWTLVTAGVAGLDSARNPSPDTASAAAVADNGFRIDVADIVLDGRKIGYLVTRIGSRL